MISTTIYLTHDNVFSLEVSDNGTPIDLVSTGVSRVVVTSATDQIDSDDDASAFDYTTNGASGIIEFDFADLSITLGNHFCSLTIYDVLHPNGQVWDNVFRMIVKSPEVA